MVYVVINGLPTHGLATPGLLYCLVIYGLLVIVYLIPGTEVRNFVIAKVCDFIIFVSIHFNSYHRRNFFNLDKSQQESESCCLESRQIKQITI